MKTLNVVLAIAGKELRLFLADRGGLAVYFLLPLLIAGLFGAPQIPNWRAGATAEGPGFTLDLVLVNQDEGPYGTEIGAALERMEVVSLQQTDDLEEADRLVADREVQAAVILPAGFSRQIDAHEPTTVPVIIDPTQSETVGLVSGILNGVLSEFALVGEIRYGIRSVLDEAGIFAAADPGFRQAVEAQTLGVIMTQLTERRQEPAITVIGEDMAGNTRLDRLNLLIVSLLPGVAVFFAFFVTASLVDFVYAEQERGSLRRLLAAPIPRGTIVAGTILAFMVVVGLQILIMIVLANLLFDMPVGSSPLALVLITLDLGLVVGALGLFLSAITRTKQQANSLALVLALVLGGLGGCILGVPGFLTFRADNFLGTLARLTPQGHVMEAYARVMAEGAGVVDVLPQLGIVLAMSVALFGLAVWRFRWQS